MGAARDQALSLATAIERLEAENEDLRRDVKRLENENGDLLDDIEAIRALARRAGLSEQVRRSLALVATYLEEGDPIESPRVVAAVLAAIGVAKALTDAEEAAA